jgi:acetolactate synthase-1/2/3 large subunit
MRSGRPGPVNLDVPLNVFVEEAEVEVPQPIHHMKQRSPGASEALAAAVDMLLAAERPVIIVGQGLMLSEATEALTRFAEATNIPVVTSPNGKGSIDDRHALAFGTIGRNGTFAGNEASRGADVILAIGFSFDDRATSAWLDGYTLAIPPSRLIQIDIDTFEIGKNYPAELGIVGDARASLEVMVELAKARLTGPNQRTAGWLKKLQGDREIWNKYQGQFIASDQMPLRPDRLMHALSKSLPDNAIVASDVGVHHNWVIQMLETRRPRQLIHSWGFAAMGFATSGILGAKLAAPDRPCVAVVGDGSFLMTPHALLTAVEYDIPVVWVVWNNQGYCSIRDLQVGLFGGRELATGFIHDASQQLFSADFAMMARSMGVESARIDQASQLEDALDHAIKANKPYLLEVPVDREVRPIGTGSWELPPLPHPEPNFRKALEAAGLKP